MPQPTTGPIRTGTPQDPHHTCDGCGGPIPAFQWVDGTLRDMRRRVNCVDCVPLLPGGKGMSVEDFERARKMRLEGHSLQYIGDVLGKHRTWIGHVVSDVPIIGNAKDDEPKLPPRDDGKRGRLYAEANRKAVEEWPEAREDPLVMMCIGFYISEGDKLKPGNTMRVANSDPEFQRKMIWFFQRLGVDRDDIRVAIHLPNPPPVSADDAMRYWSNELGVPLDHFNRTHVQKSVRTRPIRYPNGVCYVMACDVFAKKRLETWMRLALEITPRPPA